MMPAADATAVVYSHLLDEEMPAVSHSQAHVLFEKALDVTAEVSKPPEEMTPTEHRELLRRHLQAQGRDASQIRAGMPA